MGHPTNGVFNVASSRQVRFSSELWRQKFQIVAIFIPIHFHEIYIGSSILVWHRYKLAVLDYYSPQTTDNFVPKLTLALWQDVGFLKVFMVNLIFLVKFY